MQETQEMQAPSLGWEDPAKKEMAKEQPTPVFLPEKSHGQWNLMSYSPWGRKRITHDQAHTYTHTRIASSVRYM